MMDLKDLQIQELTTKLNSAENKIDNMQEYIDEMRLDILASQTYTEFLEGKVK